MCLLPSLFIIETAVFNQKNDEYISELIEKRQSMEAFDKTYITKIK